MADPTLASLLRTRRRPGRLALGFHHMGSFFFHCVILIHLPSRVCKARKSRLSRLARPRLFLSLSVLVPQSSRLHPHCPGLALYIASPAHGSLPLAKLKQQQQQQAIVSRLVLYPDRPRSLLRSCWCPRSAESYNRIFKSFVKPGTGLRQALRHQVR